MACSIFSSGQALAFNELMRRVKPQQEVKAIRDEIKVRKIERLSGKAIAVRVYKNSKIKVRFSFVVCVHDIDRLKRFNQSSYICIKRRKSWKNVRKN